METYYDDSKNPTMYIREVTEKTTEITIKNTDIRTVAVDHETGRKIIEINHNEQKIVRKETRRHISLDAYDKDCDRFESTEDTPHEAFIRKEEKELLHKAIRTLSPAQKRLLYKIFWLGEKKSAVAAELGISNAAVTYRLRTIFEKIRNFFESQT